MKRKRYSKDPLHGVLIVVGVLLAVVAAVSLTGEARLFGPGKAAVQSSVESDGSAVAVSSPSPAPTPAPATPTPSPSPVPVVTPVPTPAAPTPVPQTAQKADMPQTEKDGYDANFARTGTYTGRAPLAPVTLTVPDPTNARGVSDEKSGYGFGVAKDGVAHQISLDHQQYYAKMNFNALTVDTTTTDEKRIYLTFDCGYENGYTDQILNTLNEKSVPVTFFCTSAFIEDQPQLVAKMIATGQSVGNHSVHHYSMPTLTRTQMAAEIEGTENLLRTKFGYTSSYFRFPTGEYSDNALDLVTGVHMRSVFWSVAYGDYDVNNLPGPQESFTTITSRLHPGAVVLLHVGSSDNAAVLASVIEYARQNGYRFASLDEYPGWQS